MRRLASRPLPAVVSSLFLVACSTTAVGPTTAPSPSGSSATIVSPPVPGGSSSAPSPSGDRLAGPLVKLVSGKILFVIERPQASRLIYIDSIGIHEIPMTTPDDTIGHAVWASPDSIIFDSERDGPRHLFRIGIDGGNVVQLTSGADSQDHAAVSADGSTIAYTDYVAGSSPSSDQDLGLHVANADGTKPRALTEGGPVGAHGGDDLPAISPDGRWIAFQRVVDPDAGTAGLFLIRPDGSGLRRLTNDVIGAGDPRWSTDSKRILFTAHTDTQVFAPGPLWFVDAGGGRPAPLTDAKDPGWSFLGDWSPDGGQIVYTYYRRDWDHNELRVVDADGSHVATLWQPDATDGAGAESPDWGP